MGPHLSEKGNLELPRFGGSSDISVMGGIGSTPQWHEHTLFPLDRTVCLGLEAFSPCDAELRRQNGFTQISEEPVRWTVKDYATNPSIVHFGASTNRKPTRGGG